MVPHVQCALMRQFVPGDHVCRLRCGHVYHCICVGELAMHNPATDDNGILGLECPNCRAATSVLRSWHYPVSPDMPRGTTVDGDARPPASGPQRAEEQPTAGPTPAMSEASEGEEFSTPSGPGLPLVAGAIASTADQWRGHIADEHTVGACLSFQRASR